MLNSKFFNEIQNLSLIADVQLEQKIIDEDEYLEIISKLLENLEDFKINQSSLNFLKLNLRLPLKDIEVKSLLDTLVNFN